jgi:hypothetical protein
MPQYRSAACACVSCSLTWCVCLCGNAVKNRATLLDAMKDYLPPTHIETTSRWKIAARFALIVMKKVLWIALIVIAIIFFVMVAASVMVSCAKDPCG